MSPSSSEARLSPSGDDIRANVRRVVTALMKLRDLDVGAVSAGAGIRRSTLYSKLGGSRGFNAEEIYRLAELFDVPVDTFYTPSGKLLGRSKKASFATLDGPLHRRGTVRGGATILVHPAAALAEAI